MYTVLFLAFGLLAGFMLLLYGMSKNRTSIFFIGVCIALCTEIVGAFLRQPTSLGSSDWYCKYACQANEAYRLRYSPTGAWIEVDGHFVCVREGEEQDGVRIIQFLSYKDWPEGQPAPPPVESETDPKWAGTATVRDGKLILQPPVGLTPRRK